MDFIDDDICVPYEIDDIRDKHVFKGKTFSHFKNTDVKNELIDCMSKSKIENACYWSAEFICAGHFNYLWNILINYYFTHIQNINPKITIYIDMRICDYKTLLSNGYKHYELRMRNNDKIRKIFCEIIFVLCESIKKIKINFINIKEEDLNIDNISDKFKADDYYIKNIYKNDDPKNLCMIFNEIYFCILHSNHFEFCYWIEWIFLYQKSCMKQKIRCACERRNFANVDNKYQTDLVWIIWDIFLHISLSQHKILQKTILSALNIFCFNYTPCVNYTRKHIFYFISSLIIENKYDCFNQDIIKDKEKFKFIQDNIHKIYKEIKCNEYRPNTEYLLQSPYNLSTLQSPT